MECCAHRAWRTPYRVQSGASPATACADCLAHRGQRTECCSNRCAERRRRGGHQFLPLPRVEVELAFVIGTELSGPDCTLETVLRATDYIVAAFEIIDNRVESRLDVPVRATINDIIADNVASAGAVLGRVHIDAATTSLQRISAVLSRNGIIEDSGVSAIVGGHPAAGVASLVNHLALKGGTLLKDEVVLSGTFTSPLPVQRGDKIEADFDRCGSVSLTFR